MENKKVLISGFGGQGVMMIGELLATAAMLDGKEVTWMPSYGPEMRGGTAHCTVIISDEKIASPIVTKPDLLIAMNEPSLDKFEDVIAPEGKLFLNHSLIKKRPWRRDIKVYDVDCNGLAAKLNNEKISNIVMLGAVLAKTKIVSKLSIKKALEEKFKGAKAKFIPVNMKALDAWG